MILADKIIDLRKKAGWSQDELASKLNVTRQSVSKWEGAQSIPDMERIVRMSRLFGVTTDYLLKDELETEEFSSADADTGTSLRRVSMEQASNYLALRKAAAPRIALATLLCIVSPIVLIVLACACESSHKRGRRGRYRTLRYVLHRCRRSGHLHPHRPRIGRV